MSNRQDLQRPLTERLVACLPTEQQLLVLVSPSIGSGSFGHCSVWIGAQDHKLYVRKLMTTSPKAKKPPKDITHHWFLPMVPRLITSIKHETVPFREQKLFDGQTVTSQENSKQFWSGIYEYIPGRNLYSILLEATNTGHQIPEPMIWEYGKVMLEFIHQLLFHEVRGQGNHNDLFARNVLVSKDETGQRSNNFHVIDFGLATGQVEQSITTTDLQSVCETLEWMMKCHRPDRWTSSYSADLVRAVNGVQILARSPWGFLNRSCFKKYLTWFEDGACKSFQDFRNQGRNCGIDVSSAVIRPDPMSWWSGYEPEYNMWSDLRGHTGCYPCQRAWASATTPPESWTIDPVILWGNPTLDPEQNSFI